MADRQDVPPHSEADEERAQQAVLEEEDNGRQPIFNLPTSLVVTVVVLAAVYLFQAYAPSEQIEYWFMVQFAFSPVRYVHPLSEQGLEWLWTPVTYSFLHGSFQHLIFNTLWLLAFGAPVVRRIGTARYLLFWILSAAASAFFHAAINWGETTILIGASGVVSALMGAACRFAFPRDGGYDRTFGHLYPRQTITGAMRSRTVKTFVILWFAGNLLAAVGLPLIDAGSDAIAWDAHIGGFLFGYLLFGLFDRVR
ncbi:rhomboid family intramembrane serine protease [Rhizobiales bacterium RZME27]|uniref:Rhomboid family intramembrane serine protease n=1 Tax=Endobacterium cereale TaxID=2663029 RepID=A0A6A8A4C0_9HYPH|nr:rhomboid family intramembrane serine protease [Endobacterium cereale]MEB2843513.1 rhomboid family intramembrane serine protease [Endobacterium cereale]MQY44628.1 rhomboid family intramembrane serine protease [Endobacterium cereale]